MVMMVKRSPTIPLPVVRELGFLLLPQQRQQLCLHLRALGRRRLGLQRHRSRLGMDRLYMGDIFYMVDRCL